jgi:ribosome biogenesis GTPase
LSDPFVALVAFGADDRVVTLFNSYLPEDQEPGRVARVDRSLVQVATADGLVAASAEPLPAVGDWVGLTRSASSAEAHVETVLPRRSELVRRRTDRRGAVQVVAANVDLVLCVAPLDRPLSANRTERELALAWDSGARPVVVLNKSDVSIAEPGAVDAFADRIGPVDVLVTSAATGEGVPSVRELLRPAATAALLGASGAGKSSLVNAIVGGDVADVGDVRSRDARGRHTTTYRSLVAVPGGGVLLDTPGVRSLGLPDAEEGVALTFPEIVELGASCRFRDCGHDHEPGCAVVAAAERGALDPERLASWRKLQRDLAYEARAADPQLAAEHEGRWKAIHKSMRNLPKKR